MKLFKPEVTAILKNLSPSEKSYFVDCVIFHAGQSTVNPCVSNMTCYGVPHARAVEIGKAAAICGAGERLLTALDSAGHAMFKARIEAGKVDDQNGDRRTGDGKKLFPCNGAVVAATGDALDMARAACHVATGEITKF